MDYGPTRGGDQGICPSAIHIASLLGYTRVLGDFLKHDPCQHTPASFYANGHWLYGLEDVAREAEPQARSPLAWALWGRWYDCACLLLKAGCPVEGHELLLLMESVRRNDSFPTVIELITALISRGIDLDLQLSSGKTALDIAIAKEQFGIANVLRFGGATKNFVMSMNTSNALGTYGWLDDLKGLTISRTERYVEEDWDNILEDWCRSYPCESITSQNSRLGDMSKLFTLGNLAHFKVYKFVIEHYPQAYSSHLLESWLREVTAENNWFAPSLTIIHELLRRRRPEFVLPEVELSALAMLVDGMLKPGFACLLSVLEVLLQQDQRLGHISSAPWDSPLINAPLSDVGKCEVISDEAMKFSGPVGDMLLGSGFRANTVVGLTSIRQGCSIDQLKKLMDHGFDPRKRYWWSSTALQIAAKNDDLDMVQCLLGYNVNVNGSPRWGELPDEEDLGPAAYLVGKFSGVGRRTAFQYAVGNNNRECTQLLFESGADVNAPPRSKGWCNSAAIGRHEGTYLPREVAHLRKR